MSVSERACLRQRLAERSLLQKMKYVHRIYKTGDLPNILLFLLAVIVLFHAGIVSASEKNLLDQNVLLDTYARNLGKLETNSFGLPLFLESFEEDDKINADVYGIFDYRFSKVANALRIPEGWCDIASLHPNVKACTYRAGPGEWLLTFYIGRKVYQAPRKARQLVYSYRTVAEQHGYLDISLNAGAGPFGTRDHRMRFEALSVEGGKTFVHVNYSYRESAALRFVEKVYFATLGRDKVGFTITGTDKDGNPVYITGPRGAIERNAVRYYFAVRSFMRYPEENQFSMRITDWYDLTARYRKQLFDLDKTDYITFKTAEHKDQVILQRSIGTGLQ